MISYDFNGKVAFVTGASAGMGAATARAFAEGGAAVAVVDLDGGAAEPLAAELNAAGHSALAVQCDVTDEAQVKNAVARTVEAFGSLDMAFNNAGIMLPLSTLQMRRGRLLTRLSRSTCVVCGHR